MSSTAKSLELIARDRSTLARVAERLPTYLSDFREDPRWLVMFALGRTELGRRAHAHRGARRAETGAAPGSLFAASPAAVLAALDADGVYPSLQLPDPVTAAIHAWAVTTRCFGNHDRGTDALPDRMAALQSRERPITSGHYFERVEQCEPAMRVQADPLLRRVASDYLGPRARVISTRLWWSFPPPAAPLGADEPREMLHFDLDDWRMLKFFFYLTPVDAESGPHLFLRGSHRRHTIRHQLSLTVGRPMDEVLAIYGADRLARITGPAGSGFAEDPYGWHAGALARTGRRLMLEIGFGITPANRRRFFGDRVI